MSSNNANQNTSSAAETAPLHKFPHLRFYGDQFVFDTVSGLFFRLSPTAGFLLRVIDGGAEAADLPGLLQQTYGISEKNALRDAELFLNDLAGLGVIHKAEVEKVREAGAS